MIKRLWTETAPFDFDGRRVQLAGAFANPKPVQRPHPPILIAGRTSSVLHVVAEHADVWNIAGVEIDDAAARSALLERYCADTAATQPRSPVRPTCLSPTTTPPRPDTLSVRRSMPVSVTSSLACGPRTRMASRAGSPTRSSRRRRAEHPRRLRKWATQGSNQWFAPVSEANPARTRSYPTGFARSVEGAAVASSSARVSLWGAPCSSGALANPRRPTTIVAGNTNGRRKTTTGILVNPLLLLAMKSLPKMPTNSTASHIVMIERPAHKARAWSQEGVDRIRSCGAGCIAEKSVAMTDPFRESDPASSWSPPLLTSSALHLAAIPGELRWAGAIPRPMSATTMSSQRGRSRGRT